MTIGEAIRAYRKKCGLKQNAVARCAGIKQPNLSRIEAGIVSPRAETVARIIKAMPECSLLVLADMSEAERNAEREWYAYYEGRAS